MTNFKPALYGNSRSRIFALAEFQRDSRSANHHIEWYFVAGGRENLFFVF
jgi:hypothetical protein